MQAECQGRPCQTRAYFQTLSNDWIWLLLIGNGCLVPPPDHRSALTAAGAAIRTKSITRACSYKTQATRFGTLRRQDPHSHGRCNPFPLPLASAAAGCHSHGCVHPRSSGWSGSIWIATDVSGGFNAPRAPYLRRRSDETAALQASRAPCPGSRARDAGHSGRRYVPRECAALRRDRRAACCRDPAVPRRHVHVGIRSYPPAHRSAWLLLRSIGIKRHPQPAMTMMIASIVTQRSPPDILPLRNSAELQQRTSTFMHRVGAATPASTRRA